MSTSQDQTSGVGGNDSINYTQLSNTTTSLEQPGAAINDAARYLVGVYKTSTEQVSVDHNAVHQQLQVFSSDTASQFQS